MSNKFSKSFDFSFEKIHKKHNPEALSRKEREKEKEERNKAKIDKRQLAEIF